MSKQPTEPRSLPTDMPNPPGMSPPGTPVTPEEQQAYQRLELNAMKIIYQSDKVTDMLIKQMDRLKDQPANAVAFSTKAVMDEAEGQSKDLLPEMLTRVSANVIEQMSKLGVSAGLFPEVDDESKREALQHVLGSQVKQALPKKQGEQGQINPDSLLNFTRGHMKRANQLKAQEGGLTNG